MLLQLQHDSENNIEKLLDYAKENNMELSLIDDKEDHYFMPGRPLTRQELSEMIVKGRMEKTISMEELHQSIRSRYNED